MKQHVPLLHALHFDHFHLIIILFALLNARNEPLNRFHNLLIGCDLQLKKQ